MNTAHFFINRKILKAGGIDVVSKTLHCCYLESRNNEVFTEVDSQLILDLKTILEFVYYIESFDIDGMINKCRNKYKRTSYVINEILPYIKLCTIGCDYQIIEILNKMTNSKSTLLRAV